MRFVSDHMDFFFDQLGQFYLNNTLNLPSSPLNSTHYTVLYPQNDDRIVTIDCMTSLRFMYIVVTLINERVA